MKPTRKYKIVAHGYGVFYRMATTPQAALRRIYLMLFGNTYDIPWQADYWEVAEVK